MIAVLAVLALMWWTFWWLWRNAQGRKVTPTVAAPERTNEDTKFNGFENDRDSDRSVQTAWTALDDLQLTRLLSASAPVSGVTTDRPDDAVFRVEFEDTP